MCNAPPILAPVHINRGFDGCVVPKYLIEMLNLGGHGNFAFLPRGADRRRHEKDLRLAKTLDKGENSLSFRPFLFGESTGFPWLFGFCDRCFPWQGESRQKCWKFAFLRPRKEGHAHQLFIIQNGRADLSACVRIMGTMALQVTSARRLQEALCVGTLCIDGALG